MTEEQKQKLLNVIYNLGVINNKINSLKQNFSNTAKTLEDNLTINDKVYEKQRIDSIQTNLSSATSTISGNIIPRIKRETEQQL